MGRTGQDGETAARAWRRADEQGALGAQVDRRPQPWHLAAVWLDRARREPSHRPVIAHDPLDRTVAARGARGIGQRAFAPALIRWPLWLSTFVITPRWSPRPGAWHGFLRVWAGQ